MRKVFWNSDLPAAVFGNSGVISVLFETPSGFAIFGYNAFKLTEPEAWKHIWADFVDVVWLRAFQTFEDKGCAINKTTVSPQLSTMIRKYVVDGQTLAVGNENYENIIQKCLGIPCVYSHVVNELMWGLKIQMRRLLPAENSELTNEDCFSMSEGMRFLLNYHKFDVNLDMMVTKRIIEMAGVVYECDRCVNKYNTSLRFDAQQLMEISRIDTHDWDLLKLATALKIICDPEDEIPDAQRLFSKRLLKRLMKGAPRYKNRISKYPCLKVYKEMYSARKSRLKAGIVLVSLVERAKKAYEDEQAGKATSDHEIGPDRKKICHGSILS
ncbi:hypothetical protein ACQ4PT_062160 [Festuca glaucescens]